MAMRASTQFPKLERLSLWCRWMLVVIGVLGGLTFAVLLGRLAMQEHSWFGIVWAVGLGLCLVLGSLGYIWKRLFLPAISLLTVVSLAWFASMAYRQYSHHTQVQTSSLVFSGLISAMAILYLIGYYRSRKTQPAVFSFWWWMGRRR